jgi:hypothetical protein
MANREVRCVFIEPGTRTKRNHFVAWCKKPDGWKSG